MTDVDLWPVWEAIAVPVLLLRGARSDILPTEIARQMTTRGPKASLAEFEDVGHAPALLREAEISPVKAFLD